MKTLKSLLSVMLVLLLMFSCTGCLHKQNEIAVEIADSKFSAAIYSYALMTADGEARTKVDEQLTAAGTDTTITAVDYYSQKIDDTDYVTWVENRAVEILAEFAAYEKLFKEAGLSINGEELSNIDYNAQYYYSYYGGIYDANGVGYDTYRYALIYSNYGDMYFEHLYGKEGEKAVPAEDIKKSFDESYRVALVLQTDITNLDETALAEAKDQMEHYKSHLLKGESIVEVYNEFNNLTEENAATTGYYPAKEAKEVVSVVADPEVDSNYGVDFWNDIKDIAAKDVKVIESEENGSKYIRLFYMVDAGADNTYLDEMDLSLRWNLKQDEYTKYITEYAKTLAVKKHKYVMSEFKVKEIVTEY